MFGLRRHPPQQRTALVIFHYYQCLNEDTTFRQALAELFKKLEALEPFPRMLSRWAHYDQDKLQHLRGPRHSECLRAIELGTLLEEFCRQWHLPDSGIGVGDLVFSYKGRTAFFGRLQSSGKVFAIPTPGLPAVVDAEKMAPVVSAPVILPNQPLPLIYDPIDDGRDWLNEQVKAICADIRQSILQQAEVYERQVEQQGWTETPKRHRSPNYFKRVAKAIYNRAILKMSWEQTMSAYDNNLLEVASFADRIRSFASEANIPL